MDAKHLSVADVVLQPFQFDCWDPEDPNRSFLEEAIRTQAGNVKPEGLWEECLQAAEGALGSPREIDPTGGADHYIHESLWASKATKTRKPPWFSQRCIDNGVTEFLIQIGAHVFAKTPW